MKHFALTLAAAVLAACASAAEPPPVRFFNTNEFAGLVSAPVTSYQDAELDFELQTVDGEPLKFTRCAQVEATPEEKVLPAHFPQFRLLSVNCTALKLYASSDSAQRSFLPQRLTESFVRSLPATAVPTIGGDERAQQAGKTLEQFEPELEISIGQDGSTIATAPRDEYTFSIVARADFDGDRVEDLLVRTGRSATDAMGESVGLFIISKPSASSAITAEEVR